MYTGFFFSPCILIFFYKMGQYDNEIGTILGFATGLLICAASFVYPGGFLRTVLYAVCGFVFLTLYKILIGMAYRRKQNTGHRD